jgi:hypothetical protein
VVLLSAGIGATPVLAAPRRQKVIECAARQPLKPVFVIVTLLADESFLIDFRVLTSWSPYLRTELMSALPSRPGERSNVKLRQMVQRSF